MAGKQDHALPLGQGALDMDKTADLHPALIREHANPPQMRILGRDAAEIVPHAANDALDLIGRQIGQSGPEVTASLGRNSESGAEPAAEPPADSRRQVERQQTAEAEKQRDGSGLAAIPGPF